MSKNLIKNLKFSDVSDWFVNNKLSIHLVEDKNFSAKKELNEESSLNIRYDTIHFKQYQTDILSGESIALKVT